jgi:ssDNA-binding replication factor A large subunit
VPSRIFGNSVVLSKDDSYIRVTDADASFTKLSKFERKIRDIQVSQDPCIVEAIVLQAPETAEVNTKTGETVSVTSTLLGDDTGEVRLIGWRKQSASVSKLNVGDRIRLAGVTAGAGREGKVELTLRPYSSVTRLS